MAEIATQNPALREPGQPFHGLTVEEEKQRLAELQHSSMKELEARRTEIEGAIAAFRERRPPVYPPD